MESRHAQARLLVFVTFDTVQCVAQLIGTTSYCQSSAEL
jgi:hypothetical protein